MKKYLSSTINWMVVFSVAVLASVAHKGPHDPTDDFSYSMAYATDSNDFKLMTEDQVSGLLVDHMHRYPKSLSRRLGRHLVQLCKKYRFDPAFVLSLIQVESNFKKDIVSYAGAIGLMQLMPETAETIAKQYNIHYTGPRSLKDPFTNLSIGVAYLSVLRKKYRGTSPYFHVAAYNIGPARLDELKKRPKFRPVGTKEYYEKIKRGVPNLRFYSSRDS